METNFIFNCEYSFDSCFFDLDDKNYEKVSETMLGFFIENKEEISV